MNKDQRIREFAEILVDHSIEVKEGENIYLKASSIDVKPLFDEVRKLIIKRGAFPHEHFIYDSQIGRSGLDYDWIKHGSEKQMKNVSEAKKKELEEMDAFIMISARDNERELNGLDPEKITLRKKETQELSEIIHKERWVLTRYPTDASAQNAGLPTQDYEEFLFDAVTEVDWDDMASKNHKIKDCFDEADEVRIVSEGTNLKFSLENRKGISSTGKHNVPDGEVFYAPVKDSVNGEVSFTYPGVKSGNQVEDIVLKFKDGKVVEYSASKNEEYLEAQLNTDEGAKYLGEFGIGTNTQIDRFMNDLGLDEKIGGTIHLALGNAYEESVPEDEEKNNSAIHWDIVKDLRENKDGGKIFCDGEKVFEDGEWLI